MVTLGVFAAFIASFLILSSSLFLYHYEFQEGKWILKGDDIHTRQVVFYSQKFPSDQQKIFLVGTSQVAPLNPNFIREDLLKNHLNFTVYNLGVVFDTPVSRLTTIDAMINTKPKIVIYGISDFDFAIPGSSTPDQSKINLLPNPHDTANAAIQMLLKNFQEDLSYLGSPEQDFLTSMFGSNYTQNLVNNDFAPDPQKYDDPDNYDWEWLIPLANDTTMKLQSVTDRGVSSMLPLDQNENLIAFKQIIHKLQDNNIYVIIFVIPQEKYHLAKLGNLESLNLVLRNISQEYPDVPIYSLWDKYAELPIWNDNIHVAKNTANSSRLYSDDVAAMILQDLQLKAKVHTGVQNQHNSIPKFNYTLGQPYKNGIVQ
jgi:hypothetical protein